MSSIRIRRYASAELQRAEVYVPDSIVNLLQAHVLAHPHDRDVHPAAVPPNPAVGAHVADLEPVGVLEDDKCVLEERLAYAWQEMGRIRSKLLALFEFLLHLVYGAVTEIVRRLVRHVL